MLSAAGFAKFIGVSREAVRAKHQRREVCLEGAKRGRRFPKWRVNASGGLLPGLPRLFELLGRDSWTVYRFFDQHHSKQDGDTVLSALQRKTRRILWRLHRRNTISDFVLTWSDTAWSVNIISLPATQGEEIC